ncbi:MAG: metallophosphoesterase family protein [Candidatus Nanoarchaeia archaeon]|nr:metallophosphoesterase family protein [Candidatus Nanoarchaeia archaeon]
MKRLILGDTHACIEGYDSTEPFLYLVEGLLFTGDVGGYGPDERDSYLRIMEWQKEFTTSDKETGGVKGNHEKLIENMLESGSGLERGDYSIKEQSGVTGAGSGRGVELAAEQLCGKDIWDFNSDGKQVLNPRKILVPEWKDQIKKGNKDKIIVPNYLNNLKERIENVLTGKIKKVASGWGERRLRSVIRATLGNLDPYQLLIDQKKCVETLPSILEFIVNLPETKTLRYKQKLPNGTFKDATALLMHTFEKKYVLGSAQLNYMNLVRKTAEQESIDKSAYFTPEEVFASNLEFDTLFLGHVHSSYTYYNQDRSRKIVMVNSFFPRDGMGIRNPLLFFDDATGEITRNNVPYNFRRTMKKLKEVNPDYMRQLEYYIKVTRKNAKRI